MITCPSCTHQNEVGSAFCENCGHDLREMVPAPQAPSRPQAGAGPACPSCGFTNIAGAAFCENCGTPLGQGLPSAPPIKTTVAPSDPSPTPISSGLHCSSCGHLNVPGSMFCENCGNQMEAAAPAAPPAPVPPIAVPSVEATPVAGELCPQCGHENIPGTIFCDSCGMQLGQPAVVPPVAPQVTPPVSPPVTPPPVAPPPVAPQPVAPQPVAPQPVAPQPVASYPTTQVTGRLVVQPSGASIAISPGRSEVFIGREDPVSGIFPEIDLDPYGGHDGGVGRRHAKLFLKGNQLVIEDLDSVNGTFVNKQKLAPGQPHPVANGAELRFGKIVTTYYAN
jgi:uncharacterized OB-fold protein